MDGLRIDLGRVQINCQPGHNGDGEGAQLVRGEVDADGGHAGETQKDEDIGHAGISLKAESQSKTLGWGVCFPQG